MYVALQFFWTPDHLFTLSKLCELKVSLSITEQNEVRSSIYKIDRIIFQISDPSAIVDVQELVQIVTSYYLQQGKILEWVGLNSNQWCK